MLKKLSKQILTYLYPPACVYCREIMMSDNLLCHDCWKHFKFITKPYCTICGQMFGFEIEGQITCGRCIKNPPKFDTARHLFKYDQFSKKLIHALKYNDQTYLAQILSSLLVNTYLDYIVDYDLIIPVPMHWLKRMFRMYNQAFLLAKAISNLSDLPLNYKILIKNRWTRAQSTLRKEARQKNLRDSFMIVKPELLKGRKVILVDDVLTTGATVRECTRLLKKHGAAKVMVLTIAAT